MLYVAYICIVVGLYPKQNTALNRALSSNIKDVDTDCHNQSMLYVIKFGMLLIENCNEYVCMLQFYKITISIVTR